MVSLREGSFFLNQQKIVFFIILIFRGLQKRCSIFSLWFTGMYIQISTGWLAELWLFELYVYSRVLLYYLSLWDVARWVEVYTIYWLIGEVICDRWSDRWTDYESSLFIFELVSLRKGEWGFSFAISSHNHFPAFFVFIQMHLSRVRFPSIRHSRNSLTVWLPNILALLR